MSAVLPVSSSGSSSQAISKRERIASTFPAAAATHNSLCGVGAGDPCNGRWFASGVFPNGPSIEKVFQRCLGSWVRWLTQISASEAGAAASSWLLSESSTNNAVWVPAFFPNAISLGMESPTMRISEVSHSNVSFANSFMAVGSGLGGNPLSSRVIHRSNDTSDAASFFIKTLAVIWVLRVTRALGILWWDNQFKSSVHPGMSVIFFRLFSSMS
mmetsp:Transcript_852/g.1975  ORF Transcript_852/g.1975 Transcript_852/m.1975 type:complete len:214 (+) Transcript_852:421-1062(+)